MTTGPIGNIAELWRFPVKSMQGERLAEADVAARGVVGDRAYAVLDDDTGAVISASNVRLFPGLLDCQAVFVEPPRDGDDLPPVLVTLPGGASARSDSKHLSALLSSHFGREARLVRSVPESYANFQSASFSRMGLKLTAPAGSFVDLGPVSLIGTGTFARLSESCPASSLDRRRFRMNIIVDTGTPGFSDNGWVGHRLCLGATVQIVVTMPDPRCSMTTLAQAELPKDPEILRAVALMNSLPVGTGGPLPCAGVYASVAMPGCIRRGDEVRVLAD